MPYANRVNLQGYLEIVKVTTIEIDGKTIPVLCGYLHSGDILAIHKLVISDYPATKTINLIKEFQEQPNGQALLTISNHQVEVTMLDGKPLVSIKSEVIFLSKSRKRDRCTVDYFFIPCTTLISWARGPLDGCD